MPVRMVNETDGTFDWVCSACGNEHHGHRLDPQHKQVQAIQPLVGRHQALLIGPCERCGSVESLRADIPPWEEGGDFLHPDSLVGTQLPGGNVVTHHHVAGVIESGLDEAHRAAARFHRQMQRHPHLAKYAPLPTFKARKRGDDPGAAQLVDA